jgi:two-component system, NarL family, sensor histidine kinase UhpB
MKSHLRILHLEDDPLDAQFVVSTLAKEDIVCDILRVETRDDFIRQVEKGCFDLIFADYSLPGFDGLSALQIAKSVCSHVPFIFVSGKMGEELAIETLKSGATDYVLKDRIARLVPSVRRALREESEKLERRKAVEELRRSHEQLRHLAAHLQSVREEERAGVAREIHDELGQALTALKMDLSMVVDRLDDADAVRQLKEDMALIDTTVQTVKKICTELRPALLDHLGLGAAIEWQAGEFQKRSGIKCDVSLEPDDFSVDIDLSSALFRIFQEALTNVLRHARATRVEAMLCERDDNFVMMISDNGIGITKEQLSKANSFGLLGMRERVYAWKGDVFIEGTQNKGTTIKVIIPKDGEKEYRPDINE